MLEKYMKIYENAKADVEINSKTLQEACIEHPSLYLYYYDKLCELKKLSADVQVLLDKHRAIATRKYNEKHSISLGERLIAKYIEAEQDVIDLKHQLILIDEVKNKFEAVKEAFISRGYQLNNVTKQRVAMIEEGLL